MSRVTISVDLAKNVFELAVSPRPEQISERLRLSDPSSSASGPAAPQPAS